MVRLRSCLLLSFLMLVPLALSAQDKDQLCNDIQRRPLKVGQWAGYQWTGGRSDGSTMRMAVVGTEPVGGTPYYWYEMSMNDPHRGDKGKVIIQMLVPGLAGQMSGVRGMIMKTGTEPAMRMADQMVQMMGGRMGKNVADEITRQCQQMELVGWEQITVPAGSFRALHIRSAAEQTEAWILPEMFVGLVRAKLKDGSIMELTGRGSDAKSSITETPRSM